MTSSLRTMFGFGPPATSSSSGGGGLVASINHGAGSSGGLLWGSKKPRVNTVITVDEDAMDAGGERKRVRDGEAIDDTNDASSCGVDGQRTPTLVGTRKLRKVTVSTAVNQHQLESHDLADRPVKRFRGERNVLAVSLVSAAAPGLKTEEALPANSSDTFPQQKQKTKTGLLGELPEDVLAHCLGFISTEKDRFALQTTCKTTRKISNSDSMLVNVKVGGNHETGLHGIIQPDDTPESAAVKLAPYAQAGNLEAIYMLGMIKSYCHQDVETGIRLLKKASAAGYVRSSYALGLVLRDSQPEEANRFMKLAAGEGYLPALQELLPAREMKAKYGEPNAEELRRHLDPHCLNLLLGRHYVHSAELRELNTSHCWNPLCGRWAFKASAISSPVHAHHHHHHTHGHGRRSWGSLIFRNVNNGGEAAAAVNNDNNSQGPGDAESRGDTTESFDEASSTRGGHHRSSSGSTSSLAGASTTSSNSSADNIRVSRMKMCSRCCRAKYCSKLCQVYDWRSGRHKMECQFL